MQAVLLTEVWWRWRAQHGMAPGRLHCGRAAWRLALPVIGATVAALLFVTHALEHAARFADRLLLLHAGRVAGARQRDELTVLAGQGHDLLQVLGAATAIQAASGGAG